MQRDVFLSAGRPAAAISIVLGLVASWWLGYLLLLDCIGIVLFLIWAAAWSMVGAPPAIDPEARKLALQAVLEPAKVELTVAGVILPVLLGFRVYIAIPGPSQQVAREVAPYLQSAVLWLAVSMAAGLVNLRRLPSIVGGNTLLTYDRATGTYGALQFFGLLLALIWMVWILLTAARFS